MRNLKRVLSLALALVMVLGMMVITTSAADFTDAEEITQTEAVEVLAALGIVQGSNGAFNPNGTFTREAAAKLLTYMLIGPNMAEKLAGTAVFSDVAANRWSAGYIAYCANLGYIGGLGDGTFNPTGVLTDIELGKLVLCAIGYDAAKYTGPNWASAVTVDMLDAGLVNSVTGTAISREDACAMILEGLKYSPTGKVYTVNGVEFDTLYDAIVFGKLTIDDFDATTDVKTESSSDCLLTEVYDVVCDDDVDAFGRPITVYTDGDEVDLSYADAPVLSYTGKVTGGKLYTALGKPSDPSITVYADGVKLGAKSVGLTEDAIYSGSTENAVQASYEGTATGLTDTGVLTEVYKTAKNVYTIVVVNTYVGTISDWTEAEIDDDGDVITRENVTVKAADGKEVGTFNTTDFTKADKTAKTVVLYTVADGKIKSVEAAESFAGKITAYNNTAKTVTVDGEKYSLSAKNAVATDEYNFKADYTFYTDTYGNVINSAVVGDDYSSLNYVYVSESESKIADTGLLAAGSDAFKVKVTYLDGSTEVLDYALHTATAAIEGTEIVKGDTYYVAPDGTKTELTNGIKITGLYSYTLNDDGEITLSNVLTTTGNVKTIAAKITATGSLKVTKGSAVVTKTVETIGYATADTELVLTDKGSVTTYTGYNSFPTATYKGSECTVIYVYTTAGVMKNILVIGASAEADTSADAYGVYAGSGDVTSDGTYQKFYVDGETVSYLISDDSEVTEFTKKTVYGLTEDADGNAIVTAVEKQATETEITMINDAYLVTKAGVFYVDDAYTVYDIEENNANAWEETELEKGDIVTVVYTTSKTSGLNYVADIYVTTNAE